MSLDVFTHARGQNVSCFGGKTLRGFRKLIKRILRRETMQHVLFTAFQSNIALVFRGVVSQRDGSDAALAQRVRDRGLNIAYSLGALFRKYIVLSEK